MRGDQFARQWRIIRAIEASPDGLTVAEIAQREETGLHKTYRDLEVLQEAGFPLYAEKVEKANARPFFTPFQFKNPLPFALTELIVLNFYRASIAKPLIKLRPWHLFSHRAVEGQRESGAIC